MAVNENISIIIFSPFFREGNNLKIFWLYFSIFLYSKKGCTLNKEYIYFLITLYWCLPPFFKKRIIQSKGDNTFSHISHPHAYKRYRVTSTEYCSLNPEKRNKKWTDCLDRNGIGKTYINVNPIYKFWFYGFIIELTFQKNDLFVFNLNAAIILAFGSSLVLQGVLMVSHSTALHVNNQRWCSLRS